MTALEPLGAVFFDIGGTLGAVSGEPHARRLQLFPTSLAMVKVMAESLGLRVGVITNIPDDMSTQDVRAMLSAAGLLESMDADAIVTSRDAGAEKPDARIYHYAAGRIGLPAARCLYVGESAAEVAGAQAAGMAALLKPMPR